MQVDAGRTAGLLYLIVVVSGVFSLMYVPSRIATGGLAPDAVVRNILAAESLFRAGILASLICYTAFLLLPLALYRLLHASGQTVAVLMVALAAVSVPVALCAVIAKVAVLGLLPATIPADLLAAQLQFALRLSAGSLFVAQLFWGLWLLPFGYLVLKSGVIPRVLGILLIAGCFGYAAKVAGQVMVPDFSSLPLARWLTLPGSIGEIGTCLWLVVFGARMSGKANA